MDTDQDHPRGAVRVATAAPEAGAVALTGQLRDGQLGQWCAATLPGTAAVAGAVAARPPVRAVRPGHVTGPDYWATVGGRATTSAATDPVPEWVPLPRREWAQW